MKMVQIIYLFMEASRYPWKRQLALRSCYRLLEREEKWQRLYEIDKLQHFVTHQGFWSESFLRRVEHVYFVGVERDWAAEFGYVTESTNEAREI